MSLVFGSRDVSVGPTMGCQGGDATAPPAYVSKGHQHQQGSNRSSSDDDDGVTCISMFLKPSHPPNNDNGFSISPATSSSIGAPSDGSSVTDGDRLDPTQADVDEEEEVQSKFKGGGGGGGAAFDSIASLESSLPIKRGLSNFFNGKSKSFASLSQATTLNDLSKRENPFNKRRRILVAYKRASLTPLTSSASLSLISPNLTLNEEEEKEEEEEEEEAAEERGSSSASSDEESGLKGEDQSKKAFAPLPLHRRKLKSFKAPRSFSLSDLRNV